MTERLSTHQEAAPIDPTQELPQIYEALGQDYSRLEEIGQSLGELTIGVHQIAVVAGKRRTLDPHSPSAIINPNKDDEKTKSSEVNYEVIDEKFTGFKDPILIPSQDQPTPTSRPLVRTPEGLLSTRLVKPVVEKVADKYSVHHDGPKNVTGGPEDKPTFDASRADSATQIRGILSARRASKLDKRRRRAQRSEIVAGTNIGLGKPTFWGTKIARTKEIKDAIQDYRDPKSPADAVDTLTRLRNRKDVHIKHFDDGNDPIAVAKKLKDKEKGIEEPTPENPTRHVQTRGHVNREVRRERRSAAYGLSMALGLFTRGARRRKINKLEETRDEIQSRVSQLEQRHRDLSYDEAMKEAEEPTAPIQKTPKNTPRTIRVDFRK